MRTIRLGAACAAFLLGAAACSSGGSDLPDAGHPDAQPADTGFNPVDAFVHDSGPRLDAGIRDGGFADPDTIREGVEHVAGLRTYVKVQGTLTSTNPPVLVMHDGPHLAHEYLPDHLRFLVDDHLVVYYDMRAAGRTSFGRSSMTATVTAERHALDVADVVDWIGGMADASTVDIIGFGYGAGIGSLYASAHPTRVGKMVLVAPYPLTALQLANYNAEASSRLTTAERTVINMLIMDPMCWGNINQCTMDIWMMQGPHLMCDPNRSLFRMLDFRYGDYRTKEFVEFDLRENIYDWTPLLASIQAETTIISGPCDPLPAEVATDYAANIAGSVHLEFTGSGRFPFIEERDAFQRAVIHALAR